VNTFSIADLLSQLKGTKKTGNNSYSALCPSHDDKNNSLSLKFDESDGKILLHCHAGCTFDDITAALGIEKKQLMGNSGNGNGNKSGKLTISDTYDYTDPDGNLIYQVVRFVPKTFRQRRPDPQGKDGWTWNLKGINPTLFKLPELTKSITAGKAVCIVEGEKDVLNLGKIGITATCNSGGAGKWPKHESKRFKGAKVIIIPDNDKPGTEHAHDVAGALQKYAAEIKIIKLPDAKDTSDWIASGNDKKQLTQLVMDTPVWEPPPEPEPIKPGQQLSSKLPFRLIGYNDGCHYYLPHEDLQIIRLSPDQHTQSALINLAPLQWWETNFPSKTGADWNAAKNWLFRTSKKSGIYDTKRLRGCGTWFDEGRVVQHFGDRLIVDGKETDIQALKTRYIYNASYPIEIERAKQLDLKQARKYLEICRMASWEKQIHGTLLAGWCVVAPICGALSWRPHIWLTGASGTGKAQPHSAKVLTPTGWRTMGELKNGDYVTTPDNNFGCIKAVYPQGKIPVYKLTFADGRETRATSDHLWKVRSNGGWRLKTTKELMTILNRKSKVSMMTAIQLTEPITIIGNTKIKLPIHPYILGALLGDGHFANIKKRNVGSIRLTTTDDFIIKKVKRLSSQDITFFPTNKKETYRMGDLSRYGRKTRLLIKELRLLGTRSDTKFIPQDYLDASINDRIQLLQGLMDTDGTIGKGGDISYCTVSKQLADDVSYLVRSLGGIAKIKIKHPTYIYNGIKKNGKIAYNISIRITKQSMAFSLPRKLQKTNDNNQYSDYLYLNIKSIKPDGYEESSCIVIDHADRLYITDDFVVTHNSWIIDDIIKPVIGDIKLQAQSNSTEAGIRQALGINAFPVLFDEAEGEDANARLRLQGIIDLMRQSSSETGAPIIKGTQGGRAMIFHIRSCFMMASIGVNVDHKADKSRISILSLMRPHPKDAIDLFDNIKEAATIITQQWCASLRARTLIMIPVILENALTFGRAIAQKFNDQRIGDQLGILLAGAYSLTSNSAITEKKAAQWIESQDWEGESCIDDESDERICLKNIMSRVLSYTVDNQRVEKSIAEILYNEDSSIYSMEALERIGIRIIDEKIVISDSHPAIKETLKNTPFEKNWSKYLRRLPKTEQKSGCRINGIIYRATAIPYDVVFLTGEKS